MQILQLLLSCLNTFVFKLCSHALQFTRFKISLFQIVRIVVLHCFALSLDHIRGEESSQICLPLCLLCPLNQLHSQRGSQRDIHLNSKFHHSSRVHRFLVCIHPQVAHKSMPDWSCWVVCVERVQRRSPSNRIVRRSRRTSYIQRVKND